MQAPSHNSWISLLMDIRTWLDLEGPLRGYYERTDSRAGKPSGLSKVFLIWILAIPISSLLI